MPLDWSHANNTVANNQIFGSLQTGPYPHSRHNKDRLDSNTILLPLHESTALADTAAATRAKRIAELPLEQTGHAGGFITGTWHSLIDIWAQHDLLGLLVRRELKARYKDSSLGILWSLVRPLAQLLIYYFAIGQILGLARAIPDFAIFVFVGLTAWTLFTEIVSTSTKSIINNAGLVKKVYLPREIFPLASAGGALFNFAVQLAILLIAALVIGKFPITLDLLYAFLGFILIVVFGTAVGMLLSALTVYLRDLEHLVEVVLVVMFWTSPIVYSYSYVSQYLAGGWLEQLYLSNPVTLGVLGMQRGIWTAGSDAALATVDENGAVLANWPPDLALRMWIALAVSAVLLWLAQRVFSRLQGNFAQEL